MDSEYIFNNLKQTSHLQLEMIKQLITDHNDCEILNKNELEEIVRQLENDKLYYSNDTIVDYIMTKVFEATQNEEKKDVIRKTRIMVDSKSDEVKYAKAYQEYDDESYLVHIGKDMYSKLELISFIIGNIVMLMNVNLTQSERILLHMILEINLLQITDLNIGADKIDELLYLHDKSVNADFSSLYAKYTNEVFEVALSFLIGHEIGHHYYYDTRNKYDRLIEGGNNQNPILSPEDPRTCELVADEFAVVFTFEYILGNNGKEEVKVHQGCAIFATFIASALLCNPLLTGEKHPSLLLRMHMVKEQWKKILGSENFLIVYTCVNEVVSVLNSKIDFSWWYDNWLLDNGIPKKVI